MVVGTQNDHLKMTPVCEGHFCNSDHFEQSYGTKHSILKNNIGLT